MAQVMTIGGARFMGRFTVREFLERGDDVTLFTRGNTPIPFDDDEVEHVQGDRQDEDRLRAAAEDVDPDVVVDFAAFYPDDVRTATEIFADVDAYVYISSTSAYRREAEFEAREGRTPLLPYPDDDAGEESEASYGSRKAEGDRIVFDAAERGVNASSVRPTAMYGPYDPTERQNYWIGRVNRYDRIIVPYDGTRAPTPLGYAEDAARAIRAVVERGEPGEAYNIASRDVCTVDELIEHIATALGTSVTLVHASTRELATLDLGPGSFSLCRTNQYVVSTDKLAALGWDSTPFETGIANAVEDHLDREPDGSRHGPDRETEERLLSMLGNPRHIAGSEE